MDCQFLYLVEISIKFDINHKMLWGYYIILYPVCKCRIRANFRNINPFALVSSVFHRFSVCGIFTMNFLLQTLDIGIPTGFCGIPPGCAAAARPSHLSFHYTKQQFPLQSKYTGNCYPKEAGKFGTFFWCGRAADCGKIEGRKRQGGRKDETDGHLPHRRRRVRQAGQL